MNKIKLLDKLQTFFDADEKKKTKSIKQTNEILNQLKAKKVKTEKKYSQCNYDEFKKVLLLEIDVMTAQIEKGEKILNELINPNKEKN